jgi:hypothetical protein
MIRFYDVYGPFSFIHENKYVGRIVLDDREINLNFSSRS